MKPKNERIHLKKLTVLKCIAQCMRNGQKNHTKERDWNFNKIKKWIFYYLVYLAINEYDHQKASRIKKSIIRI